MTGFKSNLPISMLTTLAALGSIPTHHIPRIRVKRSYGQVCTAPPMPTGPTRCECGSGKRPKKCCKRKVRQAA